MNNTLMYVELAKTMDRVRHEEAEKRRLLRQLQAGRPSAFNRHLLSVGKRFLALGFSLKLRQGSALQGLRARPRPETPQEAPYDA